MRPCLCGHAEHRLQGAERVALVELVPRVPAEDRGTVEHHDALHLGVDALVQEGVEPQFEDADRIGLATGGRGLEDLRRQLVLDRFERGLEQVGLAGEVVVRARRGSRGPPEDLLGRRGGETLSPRTGAERSR